MRIGIFGTGAVGETIGTKLVQLGHQVRLGSRTSNNAKGAAWTAKLGQAASHGSFAETAAFADELLFNCTKGVSSVEVLASVAEPQLRGKILVDVANPLVFEAGKGPKLAFGSDDSLGERLQAAVPSLRVVKTLNTVHCSVMVDPGRVRGPHTMFMCGDDTHAKQRVLTVLGDWLGWRDVIDLGDIKAARVTEGLMPLWLKLWGRLETADFNLQVVR